MFQESQSLLSLLTSVYSERRANWNTIDDKYVFDHTGDKPVTYTSDNVRIKLKCIPANVLP